VHSNYGNWQYSAGVGSDPREDRYFNIVKQAHVYDPSCDFIRLWVPEIRALSNDELCDPRILLVDPERAAQRALMAETGYPSPPVVDLLHGQYTKKDNSNVRKKKTSHGGVPGLSMSMKQPSLRDAA